MWKSIPWIFEETRSQGIFKEDEDHFRMIKLMSCYGELAQKRRRGLELPCHNHIRKELQMLVYTESAGEKTWVMFQVGTSFSP